MFASERREEKESFVSVMMRPQVHLLPRSIDYNSGIVDNEIWTMRQILLAKWK